MPRLYLTFLICTPYMYVPFCIYPNSLSDLRLLWLSSCHLGPLPNSTQSCPPMAPVGTTIDFEHNQSPRPLKRPRKSSVASSKPLKESENDHFINNAPLDHIFITDGIATKKPGGKKVRSCSYLTLCCPTPSFPPRRLCHAANVGGKSSQRHYVPLRNRTLIK